METAALSLLTGVLSLSMERLGASAVMEAAGSENPRDSAAIDRYGVVAVVYGDGSTGGDAMNDIYNVVRQAVELFRDIHLGR